MNNLQVTHHERIIPGDIYDLKDLDFTDKQKDDLTNIRTVRYTRPCIVIRVNPNKTFGVIPLTTKDNEFHSIYPMQIESHVHTFALISNYMTVDEYKLGHFHSCLKPEILDDLVKAYGKYINTRVQTEGIDRTSYRTIPQIYNTLDVKTLECWKIYKIKDKMYTCIKLENQTSLIIELNEHGKKVKYNTLTLLSNKFLSASNPKYVGCIWEEDKRAEIADVLNDMYGIKVIKKNINPLDSKICEFLSYIKKDLNYLKLSIPVYLNKLSNLILSKKYKKPDGKFYSYIYSKEGIKASTDIHILIPYILYNVDIFTCSKSLLEYIIKNHPAIIGNRIRPFKRYFYLNNGNKIFDGSRFKFPYKVPNMHLLKDFINHKFD